MLVAIIAGGLVLITLLAFHPLGIPAWFWAFGLVLYMPCMLVATAVLKFLVLLFQRPSHPA